MNCVTERDPQLLRLTEAIAAKVGQERFHLWFNSSTRIDLKSDALEIAVPNDFIGEWIGSHFSKPIQEAAREVLGDSLRLRFNVNPQLFVGGPRAAVVEDAPRQAPAAPVAIPTPPVTHRANYSSQSRLRHDLSTFVIGAGNQLAYNAACHVAQFPGSQYTPLFIHGVCGLGKTHLLQGLCRKFIQLHPTKRWAYMTGEEFTNEFVSAMRANKLDVFRRKMRELDLLVIDDVHFLSGKKATQEEFLHTFNAIEAMGRQVVMASDSHPKLIKEFGESLVNRFVSGMVVRVEAPNIQMRCEILRRLMLRQQMMLSEEVITWIARRVTQNVRELEGAIIRISAHMRSSGRPVDEAMVQEALSDLDRTHVQPIRPDDIIQVVCEYFGVSHKDMLSSRRDHNISMPRSVAMYLVRRLGKHSYPEIGNLLNKKNHSTVISACRRVDAMIKGNESVEWTSPLGERKEEAAELLQRLEEQCRVGR